VGQNPIKDLPLIRVFEGDVREHRDFRHHCRGPVGVGGTTRRYRVNVVGEYWRDFEQLLFWPS
jgi:hypothetical protein